MTESLNKMIISVSKKDIIGGQKGKVIRGFPNNHVTDNLTTSLTAEGKLSFFLALRKVGFHPNFI